MRFHEAMKALEEGRKVRRKDWSPNKWMSRKECTCGGDDCWLYYMRDCNYGEWELYEEPAKTYTFAEVIAGLKAGKKFRNPSWIGLYHIKLDSSGTQIVVRTVLGYQNWSPNLEDLESADWVEFK